MITVPKDSTFQQALDYVNGEWNSPIRHQTFDTLKKETIKTIWDIGANVGVFTELCTIHFPTAIIQAIEPDTRNYEVLTENLGQSRNIIFHNCGIYYGATEGHPMNVIGDPNVAGYIFSDVAREHLGPCLDNTVTHMDRIFYMDTLEDIFDIPADLVKIDVEGSEYNIIAGSKLLKQCKFLILEFHNHELQYVRDYLAQHLPNFTVEILTNEHYGGSIHWYGFLRNINGN
jgi:FkbM family methyltransferase